MMTLQQFYDKALDSNHIFNVEFVKRTTGEMRSMTCRTGVTKGTSGGSMGYDPREHGLLPVYDVRALGFRSVPVDALVGVTMDGVRYVPSPTDPYVLVEG
jgi:hypothetical protein